MLSAEGSMPLPWSIRMKIALGAAKGLTFLHEEVQKPVIYRDFKTSNILLDAVCYCYNATTTCFLYLYSIMKSEMLFLGIQCQTLGFWTCQRWS